MIRGHLVRWRKTHVRVVGGLLASANLPDHSSIYPYTLYIYMWTARQMMLFLLSVAGQHIYEYSEQAGNHFFSTWVLLRPVSNQEKNTDGRSEMT